jgi:signal transduction histidine kinase
MTQIEMNMNMGRDYPPASFLPPAVWNGLDAHAHSVQFYEDDAFLLDALSRFIGSALGAGDATVVIATKAHRDGLAARLQARGLDLSHTSKQGRYVALDAAEVLAQFMRNGHPDAALFAAALGPVITRATAVAESAQPRVAAFGEMVALLWAEGQAEAALELEQLWNDLAQTHAFALLCGYPMSFFKQVADDGQLEQICSVHSHVIPAESYTALTTDEERLRAISHLQQKARALETEIEERKKAQESLRESNRQLREAVAARDEFLSIAAHELKTPITSLRGFAQLLLRDTHRQREISPERLEIALGAIESQSSKLSRLVARLLDTAQIEAGKLHIERVPTDLVALVQAAFTQQQADAGHILILEGPAQLEALVDPLRFEQVITNLLDNAAKFSPAGGSITVTLGHDAAGNIRLSVTDQGVGIPLDQRSDVFNRFHQAHGVGHLSGMGLGLYIIREIIALHGGSVEIEASPQGGSCFVVTLPPPANGVQGPSAA